MSRWSCRSLNRKMAGSTWPSTASRPAIGSHVLPDPVLPALGLGAELDHALAARPDVQRLVPLLGDLEQPLLEPLFLPGHHVDDRVAGADQHLELVGRPLRRPADGCGLAAGGCAAGPRLRGGPRGVAGGRCPFIPTGSGIIRSPWLRTIRGRLDPAFRPLIRSSRRFIRSSDVGIVASTAARGSGDPEGEDPPIGLDRDLALGRLVDGRRCLFVVSISFDDPQPAANRQVASTVTSARLERPGELGVTVRLPARQVSVADAELDVGQVRPQPGDDRAEAAVEMAGQEQVPHDQVALAGGRGAGCGSRSAR